MLTKPQPPSTQEPTKTLGKTTPTKQTLKHVTKQDKTKFTSNSNKANT